MLRGESGGDRCGDKEVTTSDDQKDQPLQGGPGRRSETKGRKRADEDAAADEKYRIVETGSASKRQKQIHKDNNARRRDVYGADEFARVPQMPQRAMHQGLPYSHIGTWPMAN